MAELPKMKSAYFSNGLFNIPFYRINILEYKMKFIEWNKNTVYNKNKAISIRCTQVKLFSNASYSFHL